ncbi:MAG: DUF368 domain-containing protein [Lachnospiraceae bacterium]|nr:DUF368 domain-containing protein [Lachnospiraceae bacterium]
MIKDILKGIVIGLANIIPGVSGGTMMVAMGIYDKLIHCITHLFKELKKNIMILLPIVIGMGIALVAGSFTIKELFILFPLQTSLCFVGLVVGSLPIMWKNVKENKIKPGHIIACVAFFAVVVVMALMGETEGNAADLSFNVINVIKLFIVGVIAAATMVVPGVSGSMMLLLLGYYNPIISAISDFFAALVATDINGLIKGVGIFFPFGVGVLVGIFAVAKLIEIIFAKFPFYAYWAIIGLIVASPIAIIAKMKPTSTGLIAASPIIDIAVSMISPIGVLTIVGGIIALVAGFIVAIKLGE